MIREMYNHQASLDHPNVSPLLQLYECPGRPIAFVQSFLPNGDIITYMSRISCDGKTLVSIWIIRVIFCCPPPHRVLQIKEVAAGLAYLHLNGIVHGNVHPVCSLFASDSDVLVIILTTLIPEQCLDR